MSEDTARLNTVFDLDEMYSFEFGDRAFTIESKDIKIDDSNLVFEFARQASRYAYVGFLVSLADSIVRTNKLMAKRTYSAAYQASRNIFEVQGRKATEKMVEHECVQDSNYMEAEDTLLESQRVLGILKAMEAAYKMRADMLVSLGTRQRVEMEQTGFSMNEKSTKVEKVDSKMRELVREIDSKK